MRGFLENIKNILEEFRIECSNISEPKLENIKPDREETISLYFCIKGNKKNIIKFREKIGFRINQKKAGKLEECYKILKTGS